MPDLSPLKSARFTSIETFKKNGEGVKTPIWHGFVGEHLYVWTVTDSWKVKRLRRNATARIAACNSNGKQIQSDWFDATGELVGEDDPEAAAAHAALGNKYLLYRPMVWFGKKKGGRTLVRFSFMG